MAYLPNYNKSVMGNWVLTLPIVCSDGNTRTVTIEQYVEGFVAFLTDDQGFKVTNHKCYKTSRKAINAAAKWELPA